MSDKGWIKAAEEAEARGYAGTRAGDALIDQLNREAQVVDEDVSGSAKEADPGIPDSK